MTVSWQRREEPQQQAEQPASDSPSPAGIDFGGKAQPSSLVMRGYCGNTEEGLRACFWKAEENASTDAVSKYVVQF